MCPTGGLVAARVESDDGRRGKSAEAVGLEPLVFKGFGEVAADGGVEVDHVFSHARGGTPSLTVGPLF